MSGRNVWYVCATGGGGGGGGVETPKIANKKSEKRGCRVNPKHDN